MIHFIYFCIGTADGSAPPKNFARMKKHLRRIDTWIRCQDERLDFYLHTLPQHTRLTYILAILALFGAVLLCICGGLYRIGRNDEYNTQNINAIQEFTPPLAEGNAALSADALDALRADRTAFAQRTHIAPDA